MAYSSKFCFLVIFLVACSPGKIAAFKFSNELKCGMTIESVVRLADSFNAPSIDLDSIKEGTMLVDFPYVLIEIGFGRRSTLTWVEQHALYHIPFLEPISSRKTILKCD